LEYLFKGLDRAGLLACSVDGEKDRIVACYRADDLWDSACVYANGGRRSEPRAALDNDQIIAGFVKGYLPKGARSTIFYLSDVSTADLYDAEPFEITRDTCLRNTKTPVGQHPRQVFLLANRMGGDQV
jgi:hypothetical protein